MKTLSKFANFSIFAGVITIALIMLFKHLQLVDPPLFSLGTVSDLFLVASCTLMISLVKCTWKEPLRAWLERHERNNLIGHMRVEDRPLDSFVRASHDSAWMILTTGTAVIMVNLIGYALFFSTFIIAATGTSLLGEQIYKHVTRENRSSLVTSMAGDTGAKDLARLKRLGGAGANDSAQSDSRLEFDGVWSSQQKLASWAERENSLTAVVKETYGDLSLPMARRYEQLGRSTLFQIRDYDMARDCFINAFKCNTACGFTEDAIKDLLWITSIDFEQDDFAAVGRNCAVAYELSTTTYRTKETNAALSTIADYGYAARYPATATRIKSTISSNCAPAAQTMELLSPRDNPTLFSWLMGALVSVFALGIVGRLFAERRVEALSESWTEGYLQARNEGERMAYLDKLTTLELCRDDLERAEAYSALMLDSNKREKDPMLLHRILRSSKGTN